MSTAHAPDLREYHQAVMEALDNQRALKVTFDDQSFHVHLTDGRVLSVPFSWSSRLAAATPAQRAHYELNGEGYGIHWPDVDEDLSVRGLLLGNPIR